MNRKDFLGPKTIAVAAGIPPMGTVFTTLPPVNYRAVVDAPPGLPRPPGRVQAARPAAHKIRLTPKALRCRSRPSP
jgi:hypothetical protein